MAAHDVVSSRHYRRPAPPKPAAPQTYAQILAEIHRHEAQIVRSSGSGSQRGEAARVPINGGNNNQRELDKPWSHPQG